jgi:hypothetical protein
MYEPLHNFRTLSVMPTYQCTAACKHCGTYSSPKEGTHLDEASMLSAIDQAAELGYKLVVFTGGEATLAGEKLLRGIQRASRKRLFTRLVTNAWWASDQEASDRMVHDLKAAGLREINYSTGDQHARFVSLDNIMRATRSAVAAKMAVCIMLEVVEERKIQREDLLSNPIYLGILEDFPGVVIRIIESPWMPLSPSKVYKYPEGLATNQANLAAKTGCTSCLGTTTLQADGRLAACCGLGMRRIPELQLGKITEIALAAADTSAEDDFLKRWIRTEGPEKILAWASEHDPSIEWENMYGHKCQSCIRLYTDPKVREIIRERHKEKIADVLFAEWLLYNYRPEEEASEESPIEANAHVAW